MAKFANVTVQIDGAKIRRTVRRSLIEMGVPLHRADVPVDSGSDAGCECGWSDACPLDGDYIGRHRADGGQ